MAHKLTIYKLKTPIESEIVCDTCKRMETDCPLHGMTSSVDDEPLPGHMIACIYYQAAQNGNETLESNADTKR